MAYLQRALEWRIQGPFEETAEMATGQGISEKFGAAIGRWPPAAQAAFWMLLIGTLVTFTLVFARKLSGEIHVFEIVFFRSVFGLLFMAPWMMPRISPSRRAFEVNSARSRRSNKVSPPPEGR